MLSGRFVQKDSSNAIGRQTDFVRSDEGYVQRMFDEVMPIAADLTFKRPGSNEICPADKLTSRIVILRKLFADQLFRHIQSLDIFNH